MVIFHSYVSLPEGMTTVVDCMSSFATSFGAPTEKISADDQPEGPWWLYQCCYGKACSPCPLINFPVICARLNEKRLLIIWIFWISIVLDVNIDNIRFKFNGCKHKTIYKTYICDFLIIPETVHQLTQESCTDLSSLGVDEKTQGGGFLGQKKCPILIHFL